MTPDLSRSDTGLNVRTTTGDSAEHEPAPTHTFPFRSVLAVCAHPDDESFGLGAVLSTLADRGTAIALLCLTHGEASTLKAGNGDLATVRAAELTAAARVLGVRSSRLLSYPDGSLSAIGLEDICADVAAAIGETGADCLVVFDEGGITGHRDHERATEAALVVANRLDLPVLAWVVAQPVATTLNREFDGRFVGRSSAEIDLELTVDRHRQHQAIACHASQSTDNPVLHRRLALMADTESLRWLRPPGPRPHDPIPT